MDSRSKDIENEHWLLGELLENLEPKIGSQLPTNGEVLRHFVYMQNKKADRCSLIKLVLGKVCDFYFCAGIKPMNIIKNKKPTARFEALYKNYEYFKKNQHTKKTNHTVDT